VSKASAQIRRWREDPVLFVREVFGVEPDAWQVDVLMAMTQHKRLAMKACKGPGKTAILAWACWWFLTCFLHPKIAATSISGDNLADGLWTEMSKWQGKSPFLLAAFQWTKTRIFAKDHPETWWMSARTWAKGSDRTQQANTLAGLHADNLLFVLDEVGGIPDAVMAAAEAGLATDAPGKNLKIMMAGNPTHNEGPLFRACTSERHLWHVTEITSDPDDPKRTPRVSIQWAKEQIEKYGRDNPWVLVNVFGKFPPSSINSLLGPDEVAESMKRRYPEDSYAFSQRRLGVDVARFGDDRTVIFPRQGLQAFRPVEMRNERTNNIAARVALAKFKWNSEVEIVDGTGGFGSGVIDSLMLQGHTPIEYHGSGRATDPRYLNKRAEVWFEMANWVKRGGALPNLPELQAELTAPTYTFDNKGKFVIEPKEQIKERLGFSPDLADSLSLTFFLPEMASSTAEVGLTKQHKIQSEYNPYSDDRL